MACHHSESPRPVKGWLPKARRGALHCRGARFSFRPAYNPIPVVGLTMPRVSEINHIDQLAQFRPEWQELLRQTPAASFFQSLEWLEVYWRHFGQRQKLRVLVHFADDRPRGILPLVVERGRSKVGPVRTLTFPLHEWGSFYGPIGPEPEQTLTAGLEHIRRTPARLGHPRIAMAGCRRHRSRSKSPRHARRRVPKLPDPLELRGDRRS